MTLIWLNTAESPALIISLVFIDWNQGAVMNRSKLLIASLLFAALSYAQTGLAQSLVYGEYLSNGAENGKCKCKCKLSIISFEKEHKYGDDTSDLESTGDGACEWTAICVSKNFVITAGLVASRGTAAFVKLSFPIGPAGKRVELIACHVDGSVRNREAFSRI
jgi:hypothetical protein